MTDQCSDPWHNGDDSAPHGVYRFTVPPGATGEGYECLTCGWRSVTQEWYEPVVKPCPRCGTRFEGMPDVPTEVCDNCFEQNFDRLVEQLKRDGEAK